MDSISVGFLFGIVFCRNARRCRWENMGQGVQNLSALLFTTLCEATVISASTFENV